MSNKKSRITLKGTGQLGGPVMINKKIEMDTRMANKFMGYNRHTVIEEFLKVHYPGVKINPKNIHVNIVHLKDKKKDKESSSKSISKSIVGGIGGGLGLAVGLIANSVRDNTSKIEEIEEMDEIEEVEEVEDIEEVEDDKQKPPISMEEQKNMVILLEEKFSSNKEELSLQLENILINIVGLSSMKSDNYTNQMFSRFVQKFEFGLRRLESSGEQDRNIKYYKKKLKSAKRKRFFNKIFNS